MRSPFSYLWVLRDKLYGYFAHGDQRPTARYFGPNPGGVLTHITNLWRPMDAIDAHVFVGNALDAADYATLREFNITTIVNVSAELSDYYRENRDVAGAAEFLYLHLEVLDSAGADITPLLHRFDQFLSAPAGIAGGGRMLIHCYMGSSRSACIATLYLCRTYDYTVEAALEHLRTVRPHVNVNVEFVAQLRDYLAASRTLVRELAEPT